MIEARQSIKTPTTCQRAVLIVGLLLFLAAPALAQVVSYLPEVGDGVIYNQFGQPYVRLQTRFAFSNQGGATVVNLEFLSETDSVSFSLGELGSSSSFQISLAATEALALETPGADSPGAKAFVKVSHDGSVEVSAVVSRLDLNSGAPLAHYVVQAVEAQTQASWSFDDSLGLPLLTFCNPQLQNNEASFGLNGTLKSVWTFGPGLHTTMGVFGELLIGESPIPTGQLEMASDQPVAAVLAYGVAGPYPGDEADKDQDGIDNEIEDGAPNEGDGNFDGVPDSQQAQVASFQDLQSQQYLTLALPDGVTLSSVRSVENPSLADIPDSVEFPLGLFSFQASGFSEGSAVFGDLFVPPEFEINTYYKYGPTPDDPSPHWYEFLFDGQTGADLLFDRIRLYFIDGQRGDDDIQANGTIAEPGGPAFVQSSLYFAQYANGEFNGRNKSRIILRNNSDQATDVQLRFRSADGNLAAVPIDGSVAALHDLTISPWGTADVKTDGTGTLQSGVVEVAVSSGQLEKVEGTEVFSLLGSYVSVPSSSTRSRHQIYVSFDADPEAGENTGLALYNPSPSRSALVELVLVDSEGDPVVARKVMIQSRSQFVGFVDNEALFQAFFTNADRFRGTLNLYVLDGPDVAAIGLVQKRNNGALIAVATGENPHPGFE